MIKPGITELDKYVDSRYTLVSMVAKRARMISADRNSSDAGATLGLEKPVTQAVEEITDGTIGYIRSEAIEKAREYEKRKIEAISQLDIDSNASEDAE